MLRSWYGFRDNVRQLGSWNAALYFLDRLLQAISRGHVRLVRYLLVAQPVPEQALDGIRHSSASPVREVAPDDPVVRHFPRPPEVIGQRFASGAVCHVAEVRGSFAGYLWLAFGGYDEDEVRCRYEFVDPASSAWDYDVYVVPDYRLGRTFARLWDSANRRLAAKGVRWSYSRISAFNPGSVAAHRRLGLQLLFSATFVCMGPIQLMLAGSAPFVHISLSARSRPRLKLHAPRSPVAS